MAEPILRIQIINGERRTIDIAPYIQDGTSDAGVRQSVSFSTQLALIQSCDYRLPLHPDEQPGCGCKAICLAGKSRFADGRVAAECWECIRQADE